MEGASILIVEDEAISALYIKNLLIRLEYQVLDIVATGENAIIKAEALKPSLILMDIRLAGELDGIRASEIIHEKFDIPIVFLTAHMDEDSMRRAMATDPAGYVPKPTSERELRGTIEMALKNDALKKQLQISEARYRLLIEDASEVIAVAQNQKIAFINKRVEQISGYSRQELMSKPVMEHVHPDDRKPLRDYYYRVMNGEEIETPIQVRMIKKDGEIKWMEVRSSPISWMGEPASLNFYTDITERKLADEKLLLQAMVLDQIQDRVTVTDLNGYITYVNEAESKLLKYPRNEIIGKCVDFYGEDSTRGATQQEIIDRTLAEGEWRGEIVNCDAEGKEVILDCRTHMVYDEEGKPFAMAGIATDITQRKHIEKALAESEARYRQIVESTQEGIWILDKNFKMAYVNRRIIELFGYSYDELIGMQIEDLIFDEDMADHQLRKRSRMEGKAEQYERRFRHKNGAPIWVHVTATPIFDDQGQFQGPIALITDISARKEAERVLEQQQARTKTMDALSQELSKLSLDFQATLQTAAQRIIELSSDICIIRLVTDDGQFVQPIAIYHPDPKTQARISKLTQDYNISVNEGLFTQIRHSGQSLFVSGEATPELISMIHVTYRRMMRKLKIAHGMIIPLRAQNQVIGDILLGRNKIQEPYTQDDQVFYQEIADRIGLTIANARMYSLTQKELEERRIIENEVRISEEKYRNLFELSPDANIFISEQGIVLDCNLSTSKILGIPKEELVGKLFYQGAILPSDKYDEYTKLFSNVMIEEQTLPFEIEIQRLDGKRLNLEVFPKLIKKEIGISGVHVILRDITYRKLNEQKIIDSLAEKEMLLNELNHRVKNNLASIVSILDLQKSYLSDTQMVDTLTELQERIRLMALIHEQLYRSKNLSQIDFAKYLEDLTSNLMRALLKGRDIRLEIQSDEVQMSVKNAIPCGQIVTELVTNALKYAFPQDKSTGEAKKDQKIEVSFKAREGQNILKVGDNGIGLPKDLDFYHADSLGLQLVDLLSKQLDGTVEVIGYPGTTVSITFHCST